MHQHGSLCVASLARGVPGAPPEGPNVTAKPVRPLLSRQFTAAVAAGPGGGRDQQASRSGDAHKGDGSYAHNDAAALVHRRGIRLRAVSAGEPCPGCSSCRGRPPLAAAPSSSCRPFEFFLWIFFYFRRINGNFVQGRRDDSPPGAATDGRAIWGIGRGCWPTEVGARAGGCVVRGERTRAGYAPLCPGAPASLRVLWCWLTGVCLVRRTSVDHCWRLSGCVG